MRLHATQAGDTIVEVLIAMSVISLVLIGAYVASNRNTKTTLDTQEHGQALKLVETQLEYLRAASHNVPSFSLGTNNCFTSAGMLATANANPGNDPCTVALDGNQAQADTEPAYQLAIAPLSTATGVYQVSATWETPSAETSNITMYYAPN